MTVKSSVDIAMTCSTGLSSSLFIQQHFISVPNEPIERRSRWLSPSGNSWSLKRKITSSEIMSTKLIETNALRGDQAAQFWERRRFPLACLGRWPLNYSQCLPPSRPHKSSLGLPHASASRPSSAVPARTLLAPESNGFSFCPKADTKQSQIQA